MADTKEIIAKIKSLINAIPVNENSNSFQKIYCRGERQAYCNILSYLGTLTPSVSEDLDKAAGNCFYHNHAYATESFIEGANWKQEHLWKDAQGDNLPGYDREVVVFTQNFPDDAGIMRVSIAHRPNPDGWDGKSIATGKVEHYTPKTYDKGGWNQPDVVYWLDAELPGGVE